MLLAVALLACNGKTTPDDSGTPTDGDADTDTDSDVDLPCDASITSSVPENGAVAVPVDSEITVSFDVPIATDDPWTLEVTNATGEATLAADGLSASWTGTLSPDTQYTVNATVCEDANTFTFHTVPPPLDLTLLEGNTYAVPWSEVTINEPGNDVLLKTLVAVDYVLAQILEVDEAALTAESLSTIGVAAGSEAAPVCELAVSQTADLTQNPYFEIAGSLTLVVDATTGATADIEDFYIRGKFSDDGTSISDVEIHGLVATEQFYDGNDCNSPLVQLLFPTCVPCTISDTGDCMLLEGTATYAPAQPGLDVAGECGLGGGTTGGTVDTGTSGSDTGAY
ncbi:MAG: Ig-like domain-containing protein [Myxococcota bacterium]